MSLLLLLRPVLVPATATPTVATVDSRGRAIQYVAPADAVPVGLPVVATTSSSGRAIAPPARPVQRGAVRLPLLLPLVAKRSAAPWVNPARFLADLPSADAAASIVTPPTGDITATLDGVGTVAQASLLGHRFLTATLDGVGSIAGAPVLGLGFVSATLDGIGTIFVAALAGSGVLSATLNAAGSIAGAPITGAGALSATVNAVGSVAQATLVAGGALSATLTAAGTIGAAPLAGAGLLSATLAAVGSIARATLADLVSDGAISATLNAVTTFSATLHGESAAVGETIHPSVGGGAMGAQLSERRRRPTTGPAAVLLTLSEEQPAQVEVITALVSDAVPEVARTDWRLAGRERFLAERLAPRTDWRTSDRERYLAARLEPRGITEGHRREIEAQRASLAAATDAERHAATAAWFDARLARRLAGEFA